MQVIDGYYLLCYYILIIIIIIMLYYVVFGSAMHWNIIFLHILYY